MSKLNATARGRLITSALFLLFLGPFFLAMALVKQGNGIFPEGKNYGMLIQPPLALDTLTLVAQDDKPISISEYAGAWVMLYVNPTTCTTPCLNDIAALSNVYRALPKEQDRIKRVVVNVSQGEDQYLHELLGHTYPSLQHVRTTVGNLVKFYTPLMKVADQLGNTLTFNPDQWGLFIADPNGNVMLYYPTGFETTGLLKDLKFLLKNSQIG